MYVVRCNDKSKPTMSAPGPLEAGKRDPSRLVRLQAGRRPGSGSRPKQPGEQRSSYWNQCLTFVFSFYGDFIRILQCVFRILFSF